MHTHQPETNRPPISRSSPCGLDHKKHQDAQMNQYEACCPVQVREGASPTQHGPWSVATALMKCLHFQDVSAIKNAQAADRFRNNGFDAVTRPPSEGGRPENHWVNGWPYGGFGYVLSRGMLDHIGRDEWEQCSRRIACQNADQRVMQCVFNSGYTLSQLTLKSSHHRLFSQSKLPPGVHFQGDAAAAPDYMGVVRRRRRRRGLAATTGADFDGGFVNGTPFRWRAY